MDNSPSRPLGVRLFLQNNNCIDKTLRLWDLNSGTTTRRFVGHTNDVLSVSFSPDNRQIVSASRDKSIKIWNTLGDCKLNLVEDGHSEWVSCVRFSPNPANPVIVSAGWDKLVKVRAFLYYIKILGLGLDKVQAQDKPLRTHWLHQQCHHFS